MQGRVPVELTTASAISDSLARTIAANLQQIIQAEPILTTSVDPKLVGGAVVRIGDTVYDGSIANQLKNIRQQMIDRSAHEIQSRRDRFRNTAGN
jgi:F-type H+-transporting ATPase subunit delta